MYLSVRSYIFLILGFSGAVFGLGQIWALALAVRAGAGTNMVVTGLGIAALIPSSVILARIMRLFVGRSSDSQTRHSKGGNLC
jgi:hypothetical protein